LSTHTAYYLFAGVESLVIDVFFIAIILLKETLEFADRNAFSVVHYYDLQEDVLVGHDAHIDCDVALQRFLRDVGD